VVSIDTADPEVAERMLAAGAHLINDVSCLANPDLARVCARHGAVLLLMHSRGPMMGMPGFSVCPEDAYGDVVADVLAEWGAARDRAVACGLPRDRVWLDPGIGFNKSARHSFAVLHGLRRFAREEVPIVVGASRKSFINLVHRAPPEARLGGTIAASVLAVQNGASVVRVHDVLDVHQALAVAHGIQEPPPLEVARV
jgi:dihydropteroate synthase